MKGLIKKLKENQRLRKVKREFRNSEAVMVRMNPVFESLGTGGPYFFVSKPEEGSVGQVVRYAVSPLDTKEGTDFEVTEYQMRQNQSPRRIGVYSERTVANGVAYQNAISTAQRVAGRLPVCDIAREDIRKKLRDMAEDGIRNDMYGVPLNEKLSI